MAILRITDADGTHIRQLDGATVTIGRGPGNQIILKDLAASSRHAQLVNGGDKWTLEDRGSLNKTFVNGKEIQKSPLSAGDRILIGSTELVFEEGAAPAVAATLPAAKKQHPSGYASSFLQSMVGGDDDAHVGPDPAELGRD